jgi:DNA-binding transcriptional regulator WhiA
MKIPLKNYLLDLDDIKYIKKGSDNIRIYDVGDVIKRIYFELRNFISIGQIKISIRTPQTFSNWILGKTGISINELYKLCKYWKKICNKSKKEFDEIWDKIFQKANYFGSTNGKRIKLPKHMSYELSYLLGVIMGDGHLANPNKSYDKLTAYNSELRITDGHKETFVKLSKIFEKLFDYKPNIYSELSKKNRRFYRFVIRSKPMHRFFMSVCGVPTGKKYDKTDILKIVKESHLEIQRGFVMGFFDADGCVRLSQGKYPEISISQLNPKILSSIIELSKEFGIRWNGPYKSDYQRNHGSYIRISNRENVERFLNNFPSFNPIKIKQSELLWKVLKSQPTLRYKWMEIGVGEEKIKEIP